MSVLITWCKLLFYPFLHGVCMVRECIYGECTHCSTQGEPKHFSSVGLSLTRSLLTE